MADISEKISLCMKKILDNFDKLRGVSKEDGFPIPFWDVIAITTADNEQGEAYQLQLQDKLNRGEIPKGVPYHVFADPQGAKIGNGGSTFHTLYELDKIYGEELHKMKVFILHAGGQSQRLPSASVLGKIFSALPYGEPMCQALELKLGMYLPFLPSMKPGVLVACADTIELYNIDMNDVSCFDQPGFTALAHPSSLTIGTGHGVYVLADPSKVGSKLLEQADCVEVLQKPTMQRMREHGAIVHKKVQSSGDTAVDNDIIISHDQHVYSDSIFYFDHKITQKFIKFYTEHMPLTCEIDAYGDFMQALGPRATVDYVNITTNVSRITPDLIDMRKKVFELLRGDPLTVVALNQSKFYHLGSTKEYIFHLCQDKYFYHELHLSRNVFSYFPPPLHTFDPKQPRMSKTVEGTVMHSVLPSDSEVPSACVVEYCDFEVPIIAGDNCIISNCMYDSSQEFDEIEVPSGLFMHTVPVKYNDSTMFTTVVLGIRDDLKKKVSETTLCGDISYFNQSLSVAAKMFNIDATGIHTDKDALLNLWYAELFPVEDTMVKSFETGLKMAQALASNCDRQVLDLKSVPRLSMARVLKLRDMKEMLKYRNELYTKIMDRKNDYITLLD